MNQGDFQAQQRAAVEALRGKVGMTDIAQALRRMDDGTYEVCTKEVGNDCSGVIARDRLAKFPLTNVCEDCCGTMPTYRPEPPLRRPRQDRRSPPGEGLSP